MRSRGISFQRWGLWLALFAFALKALTPLGYMPGRDLQQIVVLCTAYGPVTTAIDPHTGAPSEHDPDAPLDQAQAHCPFAALGGLALASVPPAITAPTGHVITAQHDAVRDAPVLAAAAPPMPARGPPAITA